MPSVVDIAAVSDRVNGDGVSPDCEQRAPVADAQPHSGHAFERFHVANTGFRESRQFAIDLRARGRGKLAPLADGGGSKRNFFHIETSHNAMRKSTK
jgi:hypothetical protein